MGGRNKLGMWSTTNKEWIWVAPVELWLPLPLLPNNRKVERMRKQEKPFKPIRCSVLFHSFLPLSLVLQLGGVQWRRGCRWMSVANCVRTCTKKLILNRTLSRTTKSHTSSFKLCVVREMNTKDLRWAIIKKNLRLEDVVGIDTCPAQIQRHSEYFKETTYFTANENKSRVK